MEQKTPLKISLTDQSHPIPTLILRPSLNGSKTFTAGILIYLSVRCMANFILKRGIAGIRALFTEYTMPLAFLPKLLLPRRRESLKSTTLLLLLGLSGKWT